MDASTYNIFLITSINYLILFSHDKLILCQHLFIQIFADSTPFHKDEVKNIQERCAN